MMFNQQVCLFSQVLAQQQQEVSVQSLQQAGDATGVGRFEEEPLYFVCSRILNPFFLEKLSDLANSSEISSTCFFGNV